MEMSYIKRRNIMGYYDDVVKQIENDKSDPFESVGKLKPGEKVNVYLYNSINEKLITDNKKRGGILENRWELKKFIKFIKENN